MALRYNLALDDDGRIVGGQALTYNGYFLWIPLHPVQGTADGKSPGNPYLDVKKVLALARASALPETQKKFDEVNIGPKETPETRSAATVGNQGQSSIRENRERKRPRRRLHDKNRPVPRGRHSPSWSLLAATTDSVCGHGVFCHA